MLNSSPEGRLEQYRPEDIHAGGLLLPYFQNRDIGRRFNLEEKGLLAENIRKAWGVSPERQETVPLIDFATFAKAGRYKDGEDYLLRSNFPITADRLDIIGNLPTPQDVLNLRSVIDELGNPETTLATMIFPLERGDRPELRKQDGFEGNEVVILRRLLRDLSVNNIRRLIVSLSHSPAFSFFVLEAGISVIDMIPLPAMFDFTVEQGFFKDKTIVPVTADDGAGDMGELVEKLAAEQNILFEKTVHASKTKKDNRVTIHFKPGETDRVRGRTVVIPEDILSTGGTLENTINQLLADGAEEAIVLVTYPFFAEGALERLGNKEKVTIITTDGRMPLRDISSASNIIQFPIFKRFASVMGLDRQGINFWSEFGKQQLRKKGFCLNPWIDIS